MTMLTRKSRFIFLLTMGVLMTAHFPVQAPLGAVAGILPLAPHGGTLKEGNKMNLEAVVAGQKLLLYPLSKTGQAVPTNRVHVTAKTGPSLLGIKPSVDYFEIEIPSALWQSDGPTQNLEVTIVAEPIDKKLHQDIRKDAQIETTESETFLFRLRR